MSRPVDPKRHSHLAAMATLVADGVINRRVAVDILLDHESRKPPTAEQRATWPKGYATARSLARMVERGDMDYPQAELHVAAVIDGGTYTDAAAEMAGRHLGRAMTALDRMRAETAKELQEAIDGPPVQIPAKTPAAAPQRPAEAPQALPRGMASRPVMRQPGGRP